MAMQPTTTRPGAPTQTRPMPMPMQPHTSLGVLIGVVTALMLSIAGIGLAIMNAPAPAVINTTIPDAIKVENADNAPVEEGKELVAKITELESQLSQARRDILRMTNDMEAMRAHIEGLGSNLAIVQEQSAKNVVPVNIQGPQNEPESETTEKKK